MAKKKKKTGSKKAKASKALSKPRKVSHKGARQKGLQFERDVANAIGHVYPEAKRHLEYQADSAQEGRDISNTGPYAIQCKNLQNYVPIKTIKEVTKTKDNRPVLITKGNKMKPVVVMYFDDWIKMLEEIKGRELIENGPSMIAGHRHKIDYEPKQLPEPPKFLEDLI
ncbi:MAG: hypothetical protein Unbinned1322contig1000_36 [Prokaryotic dsDNA virus sp.]|nr:hypothetical protein [Aequorivita sp.]QDP57292.1 MAG: hypothetical protein Unbinned1322contig1000_36 [Prokaryotic dsDNA virus sp.]|tara:strand:+ start:17244 stop:17747 length:504 start_codon:yes stop_codon:yes gene_type:complete